MATSSAAVVPLKLRANDIVRHIINVDSRFRDMPTTSTASDFYVSLLSPVKNVLRIRITSIEFPNNYYIFTAARRNVSFEVLYDKAAPKRVAVVVPEGNYTACEMVDAINGALKAAGTSWLTVAFDEITGRFTFSGSQYFAINTAYESFDRPFDYGLGYNLGFGRGTHVSVKTVLSPPTYTVVSDTCANFAGDNYVFLRVNDFNCVRQTVKITDAEGRVVETNNDFNALAKVVLREPKNYMAFDDYASQHAKEVVFPAPTDLSRLHVEVLDAYGAPLDLCSSQVSFSIEVLEVRNLSLYNVIRDSLAVLY